MNLNNDEANIKIVYTQHDYDYSEIPLDWQMSMANFWWRGSQRKSYRINYKYYKIVKYT